MKLLVFCEAEGDFRTSTGLVDRVLHDEAPVWVADLMETQPTAIREWLGDGHARSFFDLHRLSDYVKQHDIRVPLGHFDGKPGAPDAVMARTIFQLARRLRQREAVDAVVIVRDMDDQGKARRLGLTQAREEAASWAPFKVAVGCAEREREAWVLVGFEPESDEERVRLDEFRRELGFDPVRDAHELTAKKDHDKRSAKRVLDALTGGDRERESRCWTVTPLDRLRDRGERSGLRAFLDEVRDHILPLC